MNKMTIDELAQKANKRLKSDNNDKLDQRCSDEISVRRIRDYVTKGILDKPLKEGRNAFYTEEHLEKLISIRQMQSEGFSDSVLIKANTTSGYYEDISLEDLNNKDDESDDAMDIINQIKNRDNNMNISAPMAYASSQLASRSLDGSMSSDSIKSPFDLKLMPKKWEEYNLDDSGDIVLKIENNHQIDNIDELINNFKSILKNKESDND